MTEDAKKSVLNLLEGKVDRIPMNNEIVSYLCDLVKQDLEEESKKVIIRKCRSKFATACCYVTRDNIKSFLYMCHPTLKNRDFDSIVNMKNATYASVKVAEGTRYYNYDCWYVRRDSRDWVCISNFENVYELLDDEGYCAD